MASDINIKTWGNKPPNALRFHFHSCSVDNHTDFDPTDEPSRNNQHGADRGDTKVNDEVKSFIRNVFYKQCDEPGQPQRQVSAKQSRHDDKMGRDLDPDSDSDGIPCHLDMDAILPELIKLNLAQHRMILSLCDLTKEAVLQLRITKARLDLVDEELSLMRSSVAEQAAPSLFSGVRTRSSLEVTERHRADHYIPRFNLADIGATLAAGPDPWSDLGHTRQRVRDGSPSLRSSRQRRRSPRPEREEHVKRTRISYDGLGGQDPKMSPSTYILSTPIPRSTTTMPDETLDSELFDLDLSTESSLDTKTEAHAVPQSSLLGKLCGKMARLLLGP